MRREELEEIVRGAIKSGLEECKPLCPFGGTTKDEYEEHLEEHKFTRNTMKMLEKTLEKTIMVALVIVLGGLWLIIKLGFKNWVSG